jgi:hypothetical protein
MISISLQQEISAMVKQKCLYKVLLDRNSDIFYFSATRNQCNGETEMSCFEEVSQYWNLDIFYFSATRNQCNGETEMLCLEEVLHHGTLIPSISMQQEISAMVKQRCLYKILLHWNSDIFYFSATRNQCNSETEMLCFEEVLHHRSSDTFISMQ